MLNRLRRGRLLLGRRPLPLRSDRMPAWGMGLRAAATRIAFPAGHLAAARCLAPVHARRQAGVLLAAALCGVAALPGLAADPPAKSRAPHPPDLVILLRSESVNGLKRVGVFGAKADPQQPGLWSVQVWEETNDRVTIATDRVRCSATAPMRITGAGGQLLVRELNPGGAIHPANRLDHLIWWAVCHPSLAGRDPAGLVEEARRLGYSGQLPERQEQLQAPRP
jgi:hypothetical protein